jgi:hypothetical protein
VPDMRRRGVGHSLTDRSRSAPRSPPYPARKSDTTLVNGTIPPICGPKILAE